MINEMDEILARLQRALDAKGRVKRPEIGFYIPDFLERAANREMTQFPRRVVKDGSGARLYSGYGAIWHGGAG